jgi:hypothetical protein
VPDDIRSDKEPEFIAKAEVDWVAKWGIETIFIESRGPMVELLYRELRQQVS